MNCPFCGHVDDKVIDSRASSEGSSVRRRRECLGCGKRFTTYEVVEEMPLLVVKKDGRRQPFDRKKISNGIQKACEKRPISSQIIEELVTNVEREIYRKFEREVFSKDIGALLMDKLALLDEVAYVRFASVYRQFKDVNQFMSELKGLLKKAGE
ncbi:MAG: transcriptional regulator NrdR [Candidatus Omnitrophica bacterium CG1_02_44_16]|nr:MAG: transcriptional regulator NrdR [Candidatus Omnitrophica bacterium CG1_02_44_16]PIY83379.1 MAG: transcriptional regulator NrdR [Candidatus Omnitrophica bacterium CG_4_10_14_0_8_um_filter_44_12]PIZ84335.1 MAG: transcriptional regulator NrdR [Candidatus Omnitrophica bacterium CG_4_10_14_0_2_um_filter_44_9]